jgi:pimeloyl-ACP methyl ester carboxylesterase
MIARADAEMDNPLQVAVDAAVWRSFLDPRIDLRQRASAIKQPVMLVWGRQDPNVPLARDGANARSALPRAPFVTLDTGHAPYAEAPDAFVDAILPFLREHAGNANREDGHSQASAT